MVTDAKAIEQKDATSAKDSLSGGGTPKPSGATDNVSTPDAQLVDLQKAMDVYADKKHSKLDKQVSNLTKENATYKQQLDDLTTKFNDLNKSVFEAKKSAELDAARLSGDPEKVKAVEGKYQTFSDTETARTELSNINAEIESKRDLLERFNEAGKVAEAKRLETETGVSAELILKLFNQNGLTDPEQMESIAETLKGQVKGAEAPPVVLPNPDRLTPTVVTTTPDSARGKIKAGWEELHKTK